jgi:PhnB protein
MKALSTYLYFNGNCEAAFHYYASTFNGHIDYIGRYKDISADARENFPNHTDEQIMHITLKINDSTTLFGADHFDSTHEINPTFKPSFALYIDVDNKDEADHIFQRLADEGNILVPLNDQFWGSYYGLCVDKFGVQWKVSCSLGNE